MMKKSEITTTELGRFGEKAAADYLKKKGYRILEKNFRAGKNEIDIIASRKKEIVFVEVKTRIGDKFGTPREAVTKTKQQRYYKIAECYWLKTGEEPNARFDVIEVYEDGHIEQYKNAF